MNTIISFSGGRTSGMMLHHILQQHGGTLPANVRVCFANTGKEHPATLDFVRDCAEHWRVEIVWLEWCDAEAASARWQMTDYARAARHGEPFAGLIRQKGYLPTPVMRFCTQELKIHPIKYYAQQVLGWTDWQVAIGIRADEPHRLAKLRANRDGFARYAPLAEAGITAAASLLSQVLEAQTPPKYYLSATACAGILARAKKRGKVLPPLLEQALKQQARTGTTPPTPPA